jgi:hypothetical protein
MHPASPKGHAMTTGLAALGTALIVLLCALWWIFRN